WWGHAISYASTIWNAIPRSRYTNSPMELVFRTKPNYSRFHVFAARGIVKELPAPKFNTSELGYPAVFLGLSSNHQGYIVLQAKTNKILIAGHATWDDSNMVNEDIGRFTNNFPAYYRAQNTVFPDTSDDQSSSLLIADVDETEK